MGKSFQVGHCNASTNGSVLSVCIARFLPGGALDEFQRDRPDQNHLRRRARVRSSGFAALRVMASWWSPVAAPAAVGQACLLRYTSSGALDSSFGTPAFALGGMIGSTGVSIYNMAPAT